MNELPETEIKFFEARLFGECELWETDLKGESKTIIPKKWLYVNNRYGLTFIVRNREIICYKTDQLLQVCHSQNKIRTDGGGEDGLQRRPSPPTVYFKTTIPFDDVNVILSNGDENVLFIIGSSSIGVLCVDDLLAVESIFHVDGYVKNVRCTSQPGPPLEGLSKKIKSVQAGSSTLGILFDNDELQFYQWDHTKKKLTPAGSSRQSITCFTYAPNSNRVCLFSSASMDVEFMSLKEDSFKSDFRRRIKHNNNIPMTDMFWIENDTIVLAYDVQLNIWSIQSDVTFKFTENLMFSEPTNRRHQYSIMYFSEWNMGMISSNTSTEMRVFGRISSTTFGLYGFDSEWHPRVSMNQATWEPSYSNGCMCDFTNEFPVVYDRDNVVGVVGGDHENVKMLSPRPILLILTTDSRICAYTCIYGDESQTKNKSKLCQSMRTKEKLPEKKIVDGNFVSAVDRNFVSAVESKQPPPAPKAPPKEIPSPFMDFKYNNNNENPFTSLSFAMPLKKAIESKKKETPVVAKRMVLSDNDRLKLIAHEDEIRKKAAIQLEYEKLIQYHLETADVETMDDLCLQQIKQDMAIKLNISNSTGPSLGQSSTKLENIFQNAMSSLQKEIENIASLTLQSGIIVKSAASNLYRTEHKEAKSDHPDFYPLPGGFDAYRSLNLQAKTRILDRRIEQLMSETKSHTSLIDECHRNLQDSIQKSNMAKYLEDSQQSREGLEQNKKQVEDLNPRAKQMMSRIDDAKRKMDALIPSVEEYRLPTALESQLSALSTYNVLNNHVDILNQQTAKLDALEVTHAEIMVFNQEREKKQLESEQLLFFPDESGVGASRNAPSTVNLDLGVLTLKKLTDSKKEDIMIIANPFETTKPPPPQRPQNQLEAALASASQRKNTKTVSFAPANDTIERSPSHPGDGKALQGRAGLSSELDSAWCTISGGDQQKLEPVILPVVVHTPTILSTTPAPFNFNGGGGIFSSDDVKNLPIFSNTTNPFSTEATPTMNPFQSREQQQPITTNPFLQQQPTTTNPFLQQQSPQSTNPLQVEFGKSQFGTPSFFGESTDQQQQQQVDDGGFGGFGGSGGFAGFASSNPTESNPLASFSFGGNAPVFSTSQQFTAFRG